MAEEAELRWSPFDAVTSLDRMGDRTAIVLFESGVEARFSGKETASLVRGAAAVLRTAGVSRGDVVAIWAPNSPMWVAVGLACHLLGAVLAPIDAMLPAADARRQMTDSKARVALVPGSSEATIRPAVSTITLESIAPSNVQAPNADLPPDQKIALFRTSGTTGAPKMFHLTLRNIGWNVRVITESGDISSSDRVLLPLPMHHVFPWITATLSCVTLGATLILPESPAGPHIAEAMRRARPTIVVGVPRLYEAMLTGIRTRLRAISPLALGVYQALLWLALRLRRASGGRLGSGVLAPVRRMAAPGLRMLTSGGAHLPVEVEEELEAIGWDVRGGYGLAETSASITASIGGKRLGSTGRAVAGCEVRIDRPRADGVGEILLKGPVVFSGYIDNPAANASAFTEDGFFRSGDLGRLDEDGFLYVTGRAKEVIVLAGGDNIFPEDVEARYLADPVVAEIGVLERDGELVAVIVPNMAEIAARKLIDAREAVGLSIATVGRSLPSTWRLSGFVLSHEPLPRTRLMKLRRFLLPGIYEDRLAGRETERGGAPTGADAAWIGEEPRARIWRLLEEEFPDKPFSLDGFIGYDLGLDSFGWMNLSFAIENVVGVRLTVADIARITTVRDLLKVATDRWETRASRKDVDAEIAEAVRTWLAPRTRTERVVGAMLHRINAFAMRALFRLTVEGRENLAAFDGRPVLICPNHASDLDPLALAAALPARLRPRVRWSGSRGAAFGTRLRRALARPIGMFPVDQGAPMVAVGMAVECLRRGEIQVWFPEGLLTPDGKLLPFHEGIGHVVVQSGASVAPVVIDGSYAALPRDRRIPRLSRIRVIFGAPIPAATLTEGLADGPERARGVAARLKREVAALGAANGLDLGPGKADTCSAGP